MGEQEVDAGRGEFGEGVVHGDGVVAQVDRAEQAGEEVPVAGAAQQFDRAQHPGVAAAAVAIAAMQIVGGAVAVEGDTDLDVVLGEQFAELLVEGDTVGVDAQIEGADAGQGGG
ncbi:hypothetical protein RKD19_004246 [Streptomyces canus]